MSAQIAAQTARTPFTADGAVVYLKDVEYAIACGLPEGVASRAARIASQLNAHDDLVAALLEANKWAGLRDDIPWKAMVRDTLAKAGAL
jgi:hypothetical protein